MPSVVRIPANTRGFDCNSSVGAASAAALYAFGYRFAVRYVRRVSTAANDISAGEIAILHRAGLAVMPVQHVDPLSERGGWTPTPDKGTTYGRNAVAGALAAGFPQGVTLWLDLEGVAAGTDAEQTIAFCNNWYDQVAAAGYEPGIYVGWAAGLSGSQLYSRLKFRNYWAAYNLNLDQYPIVRGVQMKQGAPIAGEVPPTLPFAIDTNLVRADRMGGLPAAYAPDEWGVLPWPGSSSDEPATQPIPTTQPEGEGAGNVSTNASLYLMGLALIGALAALIYRRYRS